MCPARKIPFAPTTSPRLVVVPRKTAAQLLAFVKEQLELTDINMYIPGWDFFLDQGGKDLGYAGKTFEAATWAVKKGSGTLWYPDLRDRFREAGYSGNIPAFLTWLLENKPVGSLFATLPNDQEMFVNKASSGRLNTIYLHRDASGSRLYFLEMPGKCSLGETYVAFRERTKT